MTNELDTLAVKTSHTNSGQSRTAKSEDELASMHVHRLDPAAPHSIDWSHVDARFIVLVGLPNGMAVLATEKPEELGDTWQFPLSAKFINAEYLTAFKRGNIDWKDSLVLRTMEAPKTLTKEQWAKIPSEFNFAAADANGEWYASITKPNRYTNCWRAEEDFYYWFKTNDVSTLPNVPWEDSLCQRPNE